MSMPVCFSVHVMLGRFVDSFSLDKHVADGGPWAYVCACELLWCCSSHILIALKGSQGIGICPVGPLNCLFVKVVTLAKHLLLRNYCEGMSSGWTSYRLWPATKGNSWLPESVLANMTPGCYASKIMESCQLQPSPTAYHQHWLIHLFLMSSAKLAFSWFYL